ncbi:MAG: Ig domain-containing protein, partial [Candidatus Aminicenantes bacterium]|nr:Ig domain-containing protein [Candidatus Aminicenantes bacterium]
IVKPDNYGMIHTQMREVERLELGLGKGLDLRGYLVVGEELRPLPIGSTLDPKKGTFSWMPGPGFLGTYNLIFLKEDESGAARRIPVTVTIRPKFGKR